MNWSRDLISLATWALQSEDLRHRYLNADTASEISEAPGIAWCLETSAVLSIYEAALGKGYKWGKTINYECPYPGEDGKNPKRADLAFKEAGAGKNWAYLEVKYYGGNGKSAVASRSCATAVMVN